LGIAGLALGAIALALRLRGEPRRAWWPPPAPVVLVVVLAAAAPVGAFLWSLAGDTIFSGRALISSSPGLALSFGGLVTAARGPIRVVATVLLLVPYAVGGIQMLDAENQRPDMAGVVSFIEDHGPPDAPVVDLPAVSAGPQTNLEAAWAPKGEPLPSRPLLRLGQPSFQAVLDARKRGVPLLTPLPAPTAEMTARRASRLARNGEIFPVTWGPYDDLRTAPAPVSSFLAALPPRFHEVESHTFRNSWGFNQAVHVLDGSGAGPTSSRQSG
jgi:hypothetical protein